MKLNLKLFLITLILSSLVMPLKAMEERENDGFAGIEVYKAYLAQKKAEAARAAQEAQRAKEEQAAEAMQIDTEKKPEIGLKRPAEDGDLNKRPTKKQHVDNSTQTQDNLEQKADTEKSTQKQNTAKGPKLLFMYNADTQKEDSQNSRGLKNNKILDNIKNFFERSGSEILVQMDQIGQDFAEALLKAKKHIPSQNIDLTLKKERSNYNQFPWNQRKLDRDRSHAAKVEFLKRCDRYNKDYVGLLRDLLSPESENQPTHDIQPIDVKEKFLKELRQLLQKYYLPYQTNNDKRNEEMAKLYDKEISNLIESFSKYLDKQLKLIEIYNQLSQAGIKVNFIYPVEDNQMLRMHDKIIIIDSKIVITGSANMTFSGTQNNLESNVAIFDKETAEKFKSYLNYCQIKFETQSFNELAKTYNYEPFNILLSLLLQEADPKKYNRMQTKNSKTEDLEAVLIDNEIQNEYLNKVDEETQKKEYAGSTKIQASFAVLNKKANKKGILNYIKKAIKKAKSSIKLQMFLLADDEIIDALVDFISENIGKRRLVISIDKVQAEKINKIENLLTKLKEKLKQRDIDFIKKYELLKIHCLEKENSSVHDKLIVIDDKITILGSANISMCVSKSHNLENIVKITDENFAQEVSKYIDHCTQNFSKKPVTV